MCGIERMIMIINMNGGGSGSEGPWEGVEYTGMFITPFVPTLPESYSRTVTSLSKGTSGNWVTCGSYAPTITQIYKNENNINGSITFESQNLAVGSYVYYKRVAPTTADIQLLNSLNGSKICSENSALTSVEVGFYKSAGALSFLGICGLFIATSTGRTFDSKYEYTITFDSSKNITFLGDKTSVTYSLSSFSYWNVLNYSSTGSTITFGPYKDIKVY